jgi:hypothetical protein
VALSLAYRPHEIVFLPALAAAVDERRRRAGEPWRAMLRPLLEWSAWFALALVVAFAPLILAGILDDLVRTLTTAQSGHYNVRTWYTFTQGLLVYLRDPATMVVLAATAALALAGPASLRPPARTWALALLGAFFYKPMSMWPHFYLNQPITLVWAINLALVVAWLQTTARLPAVLRLAAVAVLIALCVPGVPQFCQAAPSLAALGPLIRGEYPRAEPPGCIKQFSSRRWPSDRFCWEDYRTVLVYIRQTIPAETRIADLLWNVPYPAVNGPTGHLTPFPAAGGYIHLWIVDPSLIDTYVEILKRNKDLFVVWSPSQANPFFPQLDRVVYVSYRPIARFGKIQVWRHKRAGELTSRRAPQPRFTRTPRDAGAEAR